MTECAIINAAWKAMQMNTKCTIISISQFFNLPTPNAQNFGSYTTRGHNFRSKFTTVELGVA